MSGRISKGIAGIIGLGQEAYQHNKEKKQAASSGEHNTSEDPRIDDNVEDDEDHWVADEAQQQLHPDNGDAEKESKESAVDWFKRRHPSPTHTVPQAGQLPAPVVIPQKRPDMRSRGFVRAYAPDLDSCGVDQEAFLDFIEGFHKETNKQGFFHVTNIAVGLSAMSYTLSVAPSVIVRFSAMAAHISIEAGRRLYMSKKQNSYIDEINAYYFQPRGLYAMIVSFAIMYCPTSDANAVR